MDNYDDIADEYDAYGDEAVTDIEIGYKNVLKLLGNVRGKKILDYGCGVGKFSRILKDLGADVIGVDIAEKELTIAAQKNPDIVFLTVEDARQKFAHSCDGAVMNFVATIHPLEMLEGLFSSTRHFLKQDGKFVMLNSNYEKSLGREFLSFSVGKTKQEIGSPLKVWLGAARSIEINEHYYSNEYYVSVLERAGFSVETIVEPLADTRNYAWKDETVSPPFSIIAAIAS